MSKQYNKYFGGNISVGKTELMYDIEKRKICNGELDDLINELEQKHLFINKSYDKRSKSEWNQSYLHSLTSGYLADYFSKDYLRYFAEVAEYVDKKKKRTKATWLFLGGVFSASIIVYILFLAFNK